MASRKKEDVDGFVRHSKVDKARKKALAGRRNLEEVVLNTVDNAAASIEVGEVFPSKDLATGREGIFRVTRVDQDIDAVYGVAVPKLPMPWWKWNSLRRKGLVDESDLEVFNQKVSG